MKKNAADQNKIFFYILTTIIGHTNRIKGDTRRGESAYFFISKKKVEKMHFL